MDANHKSQQQVLQKLGFYQGLIDGIWGPKTIQAKISFERDPKFVPGIPNHGLPFIKGHMLPFNLAWNDDELTIKSAPEAPAVAIPATAQVVLGKPVVPGKPQIIARPAAPVAAGPVVTPVAVTPVAVTPVAVTPVAVTPVAAVPVAPVAPAVQAAPVATGAAPAAATAPIAATVAAPSAPVDSNVAGAAPAAP